MITVRIKALQSEKKALQSENKSSTKWEKSENSEIKGWYLIKTTTCYTCLISSTRFDKGKIDLNY